MTAAVTTRVWDGQAGRYRSVPTQPAKPQPVGNTTPAAQALKSALHADARTHLTRMFAR